MCSLFLLKRGLSLLAQLVYEQTHLFRPDLGHLIPGAEIQKIAEPFLEIRMLLLGNALLLKDRLESRHYVIWNRSHLH